ncbi:MFS family permease [Novosphingobium sp. SG751A]|uniref:MFS transporter n=1 Tax=Novosphingobium sp. SG751A TaxID=2587000 RepID=UPI001551E2AD|nr:MFS transporter [Novosphingobium sp. SG751A]NOW45330.1 MFS family permease [Novosphingobium sp. SG751A]
MSDVTLSASMPRPVSGGFMALYTFTQYAHWLAILTPVTITIAMRIGQIAPPDQKSAYLATIMSVGALFAMVAAPIWGAISDHTTARIGRRKFWIVAGSLFLLTGLITMALSDSIWLFGLGWIICQTGSNAAQAAISAILPDHVPLEQRGRMSSFLGLTTVFALVSGTFITQFTHQNSMAMFIVPWLPYLVAVLLVLRFLPDAPSHSTDGISLATVFSAFRANPFRDRDFGLAFSCRFLLTTGNSFAQTYQVFLLMDVIGLATHQVPGAMFTITSSVAIIGAILTPLAGVLVDKTGRMKPLVFGAGLLATVGLLAISQTTSLTPFIAAMIVLGAGKSVIYALTTALGASVLPDRASAAKDMGIIQIASSLPQSLAPAIAPLFLAIGGGHSNYEAVFIAAALFAAGGTLAILPIRHVK